MYSPRESQHNALKQVLKYMRGTVGYGLVFKQGGPQSLIRYSDSSHNMDQYDGKSTTWHLFCYDKTPITWCSQKQEIVAWSSCEAEFMAATEAAKQAIWLQELMSEITRRSA